MKKLFLFLSLSLCTIALCSCATVMRENSQIVAVKSNVEKVDIRITNRSGELIFEGQTPTTLPLKTSVKGGYFSPEQYTITASKDGFKTQTHVIDWHVSGWYWAGNFVIGGLIGYLIVDPMTGDMFYLDEEANLSLVPEKK